MSKMVANVNKTKAEMRHQKYLNAKARLSLKSLKRHKGSLEH